jgi:outer membrane immunogenic protein
VFFGGAAPLGALVVASNNNNSGRFLVGGQAGVNWQINNFVLGIEGDGDVAIGGNNNFPGFLNPRTNTGFFATVRGRGGIAFDRLLVYGTGGVAFGARRDFGNTFIGTTFGRPAFFTTDSVSNTAVGYTVGAGVEYAFLNNWSIKAEYLFADLGRNRRTFVSPFTGAGVIIDARREQSHIVRVGLNYRFNWGGYGAAAPVVAAY